MQYTHILVTTDFSEPAERAFVFAAHHAKVENCTISLLTVIPDNFTSSPLFAEINPKDFSGSFLGQLDKIARGHLKNISDRHFAGCDVHVHVVQSFIPIATAIIEFAEENSCDLIIMASHGAGVLKTALLGSVVHKVIRHAPCPVLVVPSKDGMS